MEQDKLLEQLIEKIVDLGFDYDRMSQAGQQTYDEIMVIISQIERR